MGTSTLTVSRWELGVQSPQPHHRDRLSRLYGVSAQELGLMPGLPELAAPAPEPNRAGIDWDGGESAPVEERARRDLLAQVRRYWIRSGLQAATAQMPSL